jgi:hypothetical protein
MESAILQEGGLQREDKSSLALEDGVCEARKIYKRCI